jgi:hypothetical protein
MSSTEPGHSQFASSSKYKVDPSTRVGYRSHAEEEDDGARSSDGQISDLERDIDDGFDLAGFRERRLEELKRE